MHWVVGDIQGCARELDDLLRATGFERGRDTLICAGDLVNKGPDSLETLRLWADLDGQAVIGNHDIYALRAFSADVPRSPDDTLTELFDAPDALSLLGRLRSCPALLRLPTEPDVWVVHAGIHPGWQDLAATASALDAAPHDDAWLVSDAVAFAARVRFCTPEGERSDAVGPPTACPSGYQPWDDFYEGTSLVVHGHWALRGHYRGPRTMGLDSGCVYGGALTAWCPEEDRVVQVPAR